MDNRISYGAVCNGVLKGGERGSQTKAGRQVRPMRTEDDTSTSQSASMSGAR